MKKTVFFNMNQLGDLIFALPVILAAKACGEQVYCIVKSSFAPILQKAELIDGFIDKSLPFVQLVKAIKSYKFDRAILFSESPSSLLAAYISQIKERIGFDSALLSFLLTKTAQKSGVPSLFNNNRLGIAAGFANIKSGYTDIVKIPKFNIESVQNWLSQQGVNSQNTIVFSIGASKRRKDKCLPKKIWAEIIDEMSGRGFSCILSGAPYEKDDMQDLADLCVQKPKIFDAPKGILDSAALLKISRLFIGIDSGAMHLAAAVGTKCLGIFAKTDPLQIGPMPLAHHIIVQKDYIYDFKAQDIISQAVICLK
ncbi:MAG: glycosyltransferase family 9 protein [Elusimicrobiota bacterium]|jgi:ADP-heptose:LPS heptosyltransferase|nr:glycosyltransferase family 9 protein [Elusimicrobiota bacterium]